MTSLDIKIKTYELTDYSAALRRTVDEKTLLLMIENFSHYVRNLYGMLIEESINSNRYKGKWEPVDEAGYVEYLGTTPTIPIIYLIEDALVVSKVGYNFVISIDKYYKYPGSKLTLVKVLRAIESGTSDFNARPILVKSTRKIRSNILSLWRGYLKMKGVV